VDWIQTNDIITALAFSPDKVHLLVGFFKGTVKIYRIDQVETFIRNIEKNREN